MRHSTKSAAHLYGTAPVPPKSGQPDLSPSNAEKGERKLHAPIEHRQVKNQKAKLKPLKASAPRLDPTQSTAVAIPAILRLATEQILHNWAVVQTSDDVDAIHEMRISVRRLRSTLRVMRPVIDNAHLRACNEHTRDLARLIGEIRDADVLAQEIVSPAAAKCNSDPGLAYLMDVLDFSRALARENVRRDLKEAKWSKLKLELASLAEDIAGAIGETAGKARSNPAGAVAGQALQKMWCKVARSGQRLDMLTVVERHEMRKDVKILRYATELLAPLYPAKDVSRFTTKLQRLQDAFGYLNDVALADTLKHVHVSGFAENSHLQRAVGYVIGWHSARAEHAMKDARAGWKRLAKSDRFWE